LEFVESRTTEHRIVSTMKRLTIIFLAASLVLSTSCRWAGIRGDGNVKTDERKIGEFANIDASGAFLITWQNGPPSVRIKTDENLFPYIENVISQNTLRLRAREQIWPTHGIHISLSSPARQGARISGAVKLNARELTGPRFALETRGAAQVTLDGNIDQLLVDMTGASKLQAAALKTKTAEISTEGAADAEIAVSDALKVAITGAGRVTYSGNPPTIEKHVTGLGSIGHKD
jgi:hypothetical protein